MRATNEISITTNLATAQIAGVDYVMAFRQIKMICTDTQLLHQEYLRVRVCTIRQLRLLHYSFPQSRHNDAEYSIGTRKIATFMLRIRCK